MGKAINHPFSGSAGAAARDKLAEIIGARDGYQCFLCGVFLYPGRQASNSRVVEHLEPWRLSPDKAFDPANLRLCCKQCHDTICQSIEAQCHGNAKAMRDAKLRGSGFTEDGTPIW